MSTFLKLIEKLKETNSSNEKKEILREADNPYIRKGLFYIYNPYYKYNVTLEGLKNFVTTYQVTEDKLLYDNVFDLLDDLRNSVITGHTALKQIVLFEAKTMPDIKVLLLCALNKSLDAQLWVSTINAVYGENFIPEFNVARAYKIEDVLKRKKKESLDFASSRYVASRKIDGIRTISIYKNGDLRFFSREGNEFFVLDNLKNALLPKLKEKFWEKNIVLDGELCMIVDGREDFKQITKEFRKKNHTIDNPYYIIFDILSEKTFNQAKGDVIFEERMKYLKEIEDTLTTEFSSIIEFSERLDNTVFSYWNKKASDDNWEGLILRDLDSIYEGKRTDALLKIKKFSDAEFEVISIETSYQGILQPDGVIRDTPILARANILFKGNIVGVGTGFSQEERLRYYKNPEEIIGKTITVQYMEESVDKDGNPSLRHPSFIAIRNYE